VFVLLVYELQGHDLLQMVESQVCNAPLYCIFIHRAVYKQSDIYILDDPLSAVDAHVGRHLFDDCICDFLQGKTRLLVTHQLQYLQTVDNVVILRNVSICRFASSMLTFVILQSPFTQKYVQKIFTFKLAMHVSTANSRRPTVYTIYCRTLLTFKASARCS
jgi:ABC-type protease/lipase transport system fused ATPase/permease subunit